MDRTTSAKNRKYIQGQVKHSRAVFLGEVIAVNMFSVTFHVERVWKGRVPHQVIMGTGKVSAGPGLIRESGCTIDFREAGGKKYLVFADGSSIADMSAHKCGPTIGAEHGEAIISILSQLAKPHPPSVEKRRNRPVATVGQPAISHGKGYGRRRSS